MPAASEPATSKPAEAGKMPEAPAPIAPRVSSSKGMPAASAPRKSSLKEMPAAVEPPAPKVDEPPIALDANSTARISLADLHPPAAAAKVEAPAPVSAPVAPPEEASFDERTVMAAVPSAAPRRWPWIAGGVGLLVIVIGVAAILPGPKPAAPVAHPPAKAAVPVVEPRREPVAPAPVVPPTPREPAVAAKPPAAPEEPVVAPSKPPAPVDKPAVVPRDPAPVRAHAEKHVDEPKPAAKPHPRQVRVVSTQGGEPNWASVTIDGDPRGETPLSLELMPGKHRLHVERTGFKTVDRDVVVAAGAGPVVVGIELKQ